MAQLILLFTSVIAGILMCRIFYNASKMITPWYFKGYYKLSRTEQVEWSNRVISTAHAILVSVVSLYLLYFSDIFYDNVQDGPVTLRKTLFSTFILGVSTGYFLSDLGMIIWFYPSLGGIEYWAWANLHLSGSFVRKHHTKHKSEMVSGHCRTEKFEGLCDQWSCNVLWLAGQTYLSCRILLSICGTSNIGIDEHIMVCENRQGNDEDFIKKG
ncbi:uncharacterized protein LOC131061527 isoform X3 [Cryptomeria japonica]|uniref:uncharacterized protein LOC131061527 isoform X3 n=1 Tax=Cryptomeria japonica TaxID=3369 RepID=UPI0025ABF2E2|nr:uncharacterized protein LOC131061527 isoform X3 [Cryptomeria japonica]